jgi:hypothetical protein
MTTAHSTYSGAYARLTPGDLAELLARLMALAAVELARERSA